MKKINEKLVVLVLWISAFFLMMTPSSALAKSFSEVRSSGTYTASSDKKSYSFSNVAVDDYWKVLIRAESGTLLKIEKYFSPEFLGKLKYVSEKASDISYESEYLFEGDEIRLDEGNYWLYVKKDYGNCTFDLTFSLRNSVALTGVVWEVGGKQVSGSATIEARTLVKVKATLQPANTDAEIETAYPLQNSKDGYGVIGDITISDDKKSVSFNYQYNNPGDTDTIKLTVQKSKNASSGYENFTLDMNVRAEAIKVDEDLISVTYNSFRITEKSPTGYLAGYVKSGSKWVKKFDEPRGKTHTIKGLKPNRNYKVRLVTYEKKGGPKSAPVTISFKTGTKTKPKVKSAKITNLKQNGTTWTRGYWQGSNYIWPHQVTSYTYELKVTLTAKAPAGVKGLEYNGYYASGRKKVYTFKITGAKPASKGTFRFYSNKKYGAFSPVSKKVKFK